MRTIILILCLAGGVTRVGAWGTFSGVSVGFPANGGVTSYGATLGVLGNQTGGMYLMSVYPGSNTLTTTGLMLGVSSDGVKNGPLNCSFSSTTVFPSSIILWTDGLLYTVSQVTLAGTTFAIHSTPDCHTWTLASTLTPTVSAVDQWGPSWEVDPVTNKLYIRFAGGNDAGATMSEYLLPCTGGPATCSSAATLILGTNHIDGSIACVDGTGANCSPSSTSPTYYLFSKDETSKLITYSTSSTMTGTYSIVSADVGVGTAEAPKLQCTDNSNPGSICSRWALYTENYSTNQGMQVAYTTSFPVGWGANTPVTWNGQLQPSLHHGSVIKITDEAASRLFLSASVTSSTLLASDPGVALFSQPTVSAATNTFGNVNGALGILVQNFSTGTGAYSQYKLQNSSAVVGGLFLGGTGFSGGANTVGLYNSTLNPIVLQTNGSTRITILTGVSIGTSTDPGAGNLLLSGNLLQPLTTPASSSAPCVTGSLDYDVGFVYVCTATNTWKRATLVSF